MANETELTVLGTGNALVKDIYNTCFALRTDAGVLLVDAGGGNGIFRRLDAANIAFSDIRAVFLTHGHTDHALGMIWVLRQITTDMHAGRYAGDLDVYGHSDAIGLLRTVSMMMLPNKCTSKFDSRVRFHAVSDGEAHEIVGMRVTFFDIFSTKLRQFGFTAVLPNGKKLTCLGDEPFHPDCRAYAENSDLLMSEAFCLYADRERFKPYEKHHSTALDAGRVATDLGAKTLLLYHTEEKTLQTRKTAYAAEAAQSFSGTILVPNDLESYRL